MGKIIASLVGAGILGFLFSSAAIAQHGQGHGSRPSATPKKTAAAEKEKKPVQSVTLEGWKITFEVMSMEEHMKHLPAGKAGSHGEADHAKSHSLMVTVQDTASKEIISDARITSTVLSPSGKKETGKLTWSGDHYAGGFSPKEKGAYQVQLQIESGGMEREASFTYNL